MSITHNFVSAKADDTDETLVCPSNWNADHDVDEAALLAALSGKAGAAFSWNSQNLTNTGTITAAGILYADAVPIGIDVLYSAEIGTHLTVGNNITVGGTVDGVDIAARDHAESHSVASHNDTTATGANLNTLVGGGETALHSHAAAHFANGVYVGNDGVNRAIPHGLGLTPKLVVICHRDIETDGKVFNLIEGQSSVLYIHGEHSYAVTAPNSTNFYVGNASNFTSSANLSPKVYYWIAIG